MVKSSVNSQYLDAVIKYLSVLSDEQLQLTQFNGKDAYLFPCPFCTQYVHKSDTKKRKTGRLIRVRRDEWVFSCGRGYSVDCRGGTRSFYNFLLMLHPQLHKEYQISLGMLDQRNHQELRRYKSRATF